jgi:hypothetical protein
MNSKTSFRVCTAVYAAFVLLAAGCATTGSTGGAASGSRIQSDYYAIVRVESSARGGAAKVNGTIAGALPAQVIVETDANGLVTRSYSIQLSTNILQPVATANSTEGLATDISRVFLSPGDPAPARIYFDAQQGPMISGNPQVRMRGE